MAAAFIARILRQQLLGGIRVASLHGPEQMTLDPITYPYVYRWRRRLGALSLDGRFGTRCRVVVRGPLNSAWIEFEDGYSACVSRNALRRSDPA